MPENIYQQFIKGTKKLLLESIEDLYLIKVGERTYQWTTNRLEPYEHRVVDLNLCINDLSDYFYNRGEILLRNKGDLKNDFHLEWIKLMVGANKEEAIRIYEACFAPFGLPLLIRHWHGTNLIMDILDANHLPEGIYRYSINDGNQEARNNINKSTLRETFLKSLYEFKMARIDMTDFKPGIKNLLNSFRPILEHIDKESLRDNHFIFREIQSLYPHDSGTDYLHYFPTLPQKTETNEPLMVVENQGLKEFSLNHQQLLNKYSKIITWEDLENMINHMVREMKLIPQIETAVITKKTLEKTTILLRSKDIQIPSVELAFEVMDLLFRNYENHYREANFIEDIWPKTVEMIGLGIRLKKKSNNTTIHKI